MSFVQVCENFIEGWGSSVKTMQIIPFHNSSVCGSCAKIGTFSPVGSRRGEPREVPPLLLITQGHLDGQKQSVLAYGGSVWENQGTHTMRNSRATILAHVVACVPATVSRKQQNQVHQKQLMHRQKAEIKHQAVYFRVIDHFI